MNIILDPGGLNIPMVSRDAWGARPARGCPSHNGIKRKLVVHHGASHRPQTDADERALLRVWQGLHFRFGWKDIAYNFAAARFMGLTALRGFFCRNGANAPENESTFSIVLMGNFETDVLSDAEKNTILDLAEYLDLEPEACPGGCLLAPHGDISPTACPGRSVRAWLEAGAPRPKVCVCE